MSLAHGPKALAALSQGPRPFPPLPGAAGVPGAATALPPLPGLSTPPVTESMTSADAAPAALRGDRAQTSSTAPQSRGRSTTPQLPPTLASSAPLPHAHNAPTTSSLQSPCAAPRAVHGSCLQQQAHLRAAPAVRHARVAVPIAKDAPLPKKARASTAPPTGKRRASSAGSQGKILSGKSRWIGHVMLCEYLTRLFPRWLRKNRPLAKKVAFIWDGGPMHAIVLYRLWVAADRRTMVDGRLVCEFDSEPEVERFRMVDPPKKDREVETECAKRGLMLILPDRTIYIHSLPPNCTALVQPADRGFIALFKLLNSNRFWRDNFPNEPPTVSQLIAAVARLNATTLMQSLHDTTQEMLGKEYVPNFWNALNGLPSHKERARHQRVPGAPRAKRGTSAGPASSETTAPAPPPKVVLPAVMSQSAEEKLLHDTKGRVTHLEKQLARTQEELRKARALQARLEAKMRPTATAPLPPAETPTAARSATDSGPPSRPERHHSDSDTSDDDPVLNNLLDDASMPESEVVGERALRPMFSSSVGSRADSDSSDASSFASSDSSTGTTRHGAAVLARRTHSVLELCMANSTPATTRKRARPPAASRQAPPRSSSSTSSSSSSSSVVAAVRERRGTRAPPRRPTDCGASAAATAAAPQAALEAGRGTSPAYQASAFFVPLLHAKVARMHPDRAPPRGAARLIADARASYEQWRATTTTGQWPPWDQILDDVPDVPDSARWRYEYVQPERQEELLHLVDHSLPPRLLAVTAWCTEGTRQASRGQDGCELLGVGASGGRGGAVGTPGLRGRGLAGACRSAPTAS